MRNQRRAAAARRRVPGRPAAGSESGRGASRNGPGAVTRGGSRTAVQTCNENSQSGELNCELIGMSVHLCNRIYSFFEHPKTINMNNPTFQNKHGVCLTVTEQQNKGKSAYFAPSSPGPVRQTSSKRTVPSLRHRPQRLRTGVNTVAFPAAGHGAVDLTVGGR